MILHIFEKHPDMDAYKVGASFTPYAIMAQDKRFTDSELAAEWWSAIARSTASRLTSRAHLYDQEAATLRRFARLAHFDEVT